jgi:hypothetical protein
VNVRRWFFEVLALLLIVGSLVFFWECVSYLAKRDYIAALVLTGIGFAVLTVGKELARLALVQRE